MNAGELLSELRGRGIAVRATPHGTLRCRPKDALTKKDVSNLKEHKRELLEIISCAGEDIEPSPQSPPSPLKEKADTYGGSGGDGYGDGCGDTVPHTVPTTAAEHLERRASEEAQRLGLVARWSYEYGFVSLHDPTSGEWHDLPTQDAPEWATREARRRKELYKSGNRRAYRLTSREMGELWEEEQTEMWKHPAVTDRGVVYEDYLPEEGA